MFLFDALSVVGMCCFFFLLHMFHSFFDVKAMAFLRLFMLR